MSQKTIVRYKNLELLCKPNTVSKFREGNLTIDKVVMCEEIFKSIQKGNRTNNGDLENTFGTSNVMECIKIMLEKGDYQISAEERKEKMAKKRSEIIGYIHRNYMDPKTKNAIPVTRIESALEQMKAKIDPDTPVDKLLQPILKKLPSIMPVKKQEGMHAAVKIPHKFLGQSGSLLRRYCVINSERYDSYGCIYEVMMAPNESDGLLKAITKLTQNDFSFDIVQ